MQNSKVVKKNIRGYCFLALIFIQQNDIITLLNIGVSLWIKSKVLKLII